MIGCLSAKWRYWRVFVYFHFFYNHIPHTQIYCSKLRMKFKCKKKKDYKTQKNAQLRYTFEIIKNM